MSVKLLHIVNPLSGLRPWTPMGNFRPQTPWVTAFKRKFLARPVDLALKVKKEKNKRAKYNAFDCHRGACSLMTKNMSDSELGYTQRSSKPSAKGGTKTQEFH